ncbi:MAG: Glutaredoxin/thioredoxin-like protein [Microgenomates group bacterium GW2011_GWA2_46_16]|nr:MAG: Glutaredoxin/thioredoxin-like protein [Microgenomates group bacterium GW2011_GWA2_46_16]
MITIQFVTVPGCHECAKAKKIFEELKPQYPEMQIEEIDAATAKGMELVQKYSIMASPGIIINGELFSTGALNKEDFVKKLHQLKNN